WVVQAVQVVLGGEMLSQGGTGQGTGGTAFLPVPRCLTCRTASAHRLSLCSPTCTACTTFAIGPRTLTEDLIRAGQ
ncbi:MAG TPA: hypothetical protein VGO18_03200, partial [Steroidobacteraceae bacterium]|nr:hypothetical protein [Steroidobacteraceae bacterium]